MKMLTHSEIALALLSGVDNATAPPALIGGIPSWRELLGAANPATAKPVPPAKPGGDRRGLFEGERDDGSLGGSNAATAVRSDSADAAHAYAAGLAQQRRSAPAKVEKPAAVVEPVVEQTRPDLPVTEVEVYRRREVQLADMKRQLAAIAKSRGVRLGDADTEAAQKLADARRLVLDAAVEKRREQRELKERRRAAKRLGI